jgi:hypothetical protein
MIAAFFSFDGSSTQSDEFSFTKVQAVVTKRSAESQDFGKGVGSSQAVCQVQNGER